MLEGNSARRSPEAQNRIESFYRKYQSILHRYFMRRTRNHAEADDLTQDLLVRVTQQLDRNEIDNPDVFVFTVAANLLKDRGRKLGRLNRYAADLELISKNMEDLSPERVLVDKQALEMLLKHLKSLAAINPRACEVFILHRIENLKHAEIAQIYGIATSTVEKDMMRALAHLAKCAYDTREKT